MAKLAVGLLGALLLTMLGASTVQQGLRDAKQSLLHWPYYEVRDMRKAVAISPQKIVTRAPDERSVPVDGREWVTDRETLARTLTNPFSATDSVLAQGKRKYERVCAACHGASLAGDGAVSRQFMPPPDLLGQMVRDRKDGYIYSYIRNGGLVMPSYGAQVDAEEAWKIVTYIRHMQETTPR